MSVFEGSPEFAMNMLWKQGDSYLRQMVDLGIAELDEIEEFRKLQRASTVDENYSVTRLNDDLQIEGTVHETKGSGLVEVTYRIEWGWDMRDLPNVYREDWRGNQVNKVTTMPRREFPRIAQSVGGLVSEAFILQPS